MAKRIHKYTITQEQIDAVLNVEAEGHSNTICVTMPGGAHIFGLRTINMKPRIFALVDPEAPEVARPFALFPTGVDIPEKLIGGNYVGSFCKDAKTFHVLEAAWPVP